MSSKKPIEITLFHADWCGYCVKFGPDWKKIKSNKLASKIVDFAEYEESNIGKLDKSTRTIDNQDVRKFGYPCIKIRVNDKVYRYEGARSEPEIYKSIINVLEKNK
jgi:thiol-disulfide isomerase/thioredoxin